MGQKLVMGLPSPRPDIEKGSGVPQDVVLEVILFMYANGQIGTLKMKRPKRAVNSTIFYDEVYITRLEKYIDQLEQENERITTIIFGNQRRRRTKK